MHWDKSLPTHEFLCLRKTQRNKDEKWRKNKSQPKQTIAMDTYVYELYKL